MYVTIQDLIIDKEIHLTKGEEKVLIGTVIKCPAPNHPIPTLGWKQDCLPGVGALLSMAD